MVPGAKGALERARAAAVPEAGAPDQGEFQPLARVQRGQGDHGFAGHDPLLALLAVVVAELLLDQPVPQSSRAGLPLLLPLLLQQFPHLTQVVPALLTPRPAQQSLRR